VLLVDDDATEEKEWIILIHVTKVMVSRFIEIHDFLLGFHGMVRTHERAAHKASDALVAG
jgi:hypothetical protein